MPFQPTDAWLAEVRARVVELPLARKQRFMRDYQLRRPMRRRSCGTCRWATTSRALRNRRRIRRRGELDH